ncbi:hypothetical protein BC940DRAFT_306824, partial [Gongronella butleri]
MLSASSPQLFPTQMEPIHTFSFLDRGKALGQQMMRSSRKLLSRQASRETLASISSYQSDYDASEWSYPTSSASSLIDFSMEDDEENNIMQQEEQEIAQLSESDAEHLEMTSNATEQNDISASTHALMPPTAAFAHPDQGYSNFYLKLENGNYLVRVRNAQRKIIATYEVDGNM